MKYNQKLQIKSDWGAKFGIKITTNTKFYSGHYLI